MKILKKIHVVFIATVLLCMACDDNAIEPVVPVGDKNTITATTSAELNALPVDNGGTHKPYVVGSTAAKYGYYLYTPGGYSSTTQKYPLLIFLHGKAEQGNGTNSLTVLNKVLSNGPPRLIKDGKWKPTNPMLVVSPQYHGTTGNLNNWGGGNYLNLKTFIEYMIRTYKVDPKRIYLTGLSFGGNGVYDYILGQEDETNLIAAAAPIAAYGYKKYLTRCNNTPVWTFVGERDVTNFQTSLAFVTKFNLQLPAPQYKAKISSFKGAGHDVWTRTYSGSGIGTANPVNSPFNQSLYDWMYTYKRP